MELSETLDACDAALAATHWWQWRRPALELTQPVVRGHRGKFVPDPVGADPDAMRTTGVYPQAKYGYSRGQVRKIRAEILEAIRGEMARAAAL